MAQPYTIEAMAPSDVAEVLTIERASFTFPWSERAFLSELALPYSIYLVARGTQNGNGAGPYPRSSWWTLGKRRPAKSAVLGYGGLQVILDEGHITTIAVAPQERGRGLGELILQRLIQEARQRGVLRVTLEVRVSNHVAQALYQKYGFTVEGRRKRYYGDGEDALIMWTGRLDEPETEARLERLRQQLMKRVGVKS